MYIHTPFVALLVISLRSIIYYFERFRIRSREKMKIPSAIHPKKKQQTQKKVKYIHQEKHKKIHIFSHAFIGFEICCCCLC